MNRSRPVSHFTIVSGSTRMSDCVCSTTGGTRVQNRATTARSDSATVIQNAPRRGMPEFR
jgi:hypothetical protein